MCVCVYIYSEYLGWNLILRDFWIYLLRNDFVSINDIHFASFLFHEFMRVRPQPSVLLLNKLLVAVVKIDYYSVALSMFDEMHQSCVPLNE